MPIWAVFTTYINMRMNNNLDKNAVKWFPTCIEGCTACGKCTKLCPQGIDISQELQRLRTAFLEFLAT